MKRHKQKSGQVLVLGIIMILILLFAVFLFFDLHNVIRGKMKLETAEQAAALTAARWQAQSLNLIGDLNLLIAAENVLLSDEIAVPDHLHDVPEDKPEERDRKAIQRATARVKALNEMQSRITFIGPMIALISAQQTAKNNGITPIRKSSDTSKGPANLADDFQQYIERLENPTNIYFASDNTVINGYKWYDPYKGLLSEIIGNGVTVRPSAMIMGLEGIQPPYLADADFYAAIIACSKGYPAWCQWRLLNLLTMENVDEFFEGTSWYTPDFSEITFSQQSEIYPLELLRDPENVPDSDYERFRKEAGSFGHNAMSYVKAGIYETSFYLYNRRWNPENTTYTGPIVGDGSPWRRGQYLRGDVDEWALYGGAMAYAECVEKVPGAIPFRSAYGKEKAKRIAAGRDALDTSDKNALIKKRTNSDIQVGGNYTVDKVNSGCVAKPLGKLNGDRNPVAIPVVLPIFERASLIPSQMQLVRIFSYEWPLIEKFILALKDITDAGKTIYDEDVEIPAGAEYMLEALRLIGSKEFRRQGFNPDFTSKSVSNKQLYAIFNKGNHLYHPQTNPTGPGWLQQPVVHLSHGMRLPDEIKTDTLYYYTAAIANGLNLTLEKDEPLYYVPPAGETWIFHEGSYIKTKDGKFSDIMKDDPYQGCGTLPCRCNRKPCTCKGTPSGTNNGPSRL